LKATKALIDAIDIMQNLDAIAYLAIALELATEQDELYV